MKKMKLSRLLAVLLAMMIAITPCIAGVAEGNATDPATGTATGTGTGDKEEDKEPPATSDVESVTVSAGTTTLKVGESTTVSAVKKPGTSAATISLELVANPATCAELSGNTLKALGEGTATVKATAGDKSASVTITIRPKTVAVTGVEMSKSSLTLTIGQTETGTLKGNVTPSDAANKNVSYSSSNKNVATVDSNGTVKAVARGTATITVTTEDGGHTDTCTVTVTDPNAVNSIKIKGAPAEMYVGQNVTLTAEKDPATSTKAVTWAVTSGSATINNGTLTASAAGNVTVKVTCDGKEDTASINVYDYATSITLPKNLTLTTGNTTTLTAAVVPATAKRAVTWKSDSDKVTVDSTGKVTAVKAGTATITATSADGKVSATCTVTVNNPVIKVTGVTLNKGSLSLVEGGSEKLIAEVHPTEATNKAVTWSSSNEAVATVSADGTVTAKGVGSATITVTTADGGKTASITVTVTAKPIAVSGVALNPTTLSLKTGASATLTATITPNNATNTGVEWSSSDAAVAKVEDGKVTALKAGTATITVKTKDGGKTATCTVTVTDPVKVKNIELNFASKALEVGDTFQLKATVSPSTADDTSVTFESKDPSIATVAADGTVTAKAKGTTNITVTAKDGSNVMVFCSVTVNEKTIVPVTGITGVPSTLTIAPGAVYQLNPSVEPSNATEKGFTYASANTSVVTVNESGIITAVGSSGQAYVYVRSKANPSLQKEMLVTVGTPKAVQSIALNSNAATLWVGGTYQLTATVMPTDASVKEVTYSSDNTTVATVDSTGKITAKAKGTAKITVSAMDGSGKTATCTVTVKQLATGVVITPTSFTMAKGESKTLTAIISPTGADETGIIWTSSNQAVATVYNGVVYANADGVATITATCVNASNIKASCTVTVGTKVSSIGLAPATAAMKTGSTLYISSVVSPTNASNKSLIWKSNDTNKAIVNNGSVTAYAPGVVTITATAADGSGVTAQCVITITGEAIATPTPVPTPSPSPTIPPATKINCIANTTKGSLNVRDRASTAGNVIARIPQYGAFTVTAWGSTWCQVSYNGVTGYVMTQYVKKVEDPSVTPTPGPTMPAGQTAQVNTAKGSLNMRSKVDGPVIAKIPEKAYFIVLEYGATWCKAWYDGHEGYVMTKFLVLTGGSMSDVPTPKPTMEPVIDYGKVTTVSGGLNLRSNPDGTKLAVIPQNATVAVHIKDTTWCRVTYGGKTGYVMTKFLTFGASAPTETPEVPEGTVTSYARVTTVSGGLNLRQTVNGTRIAVIPQNAVIGVITKGADWSYVKYGTKVGYVMTKFLTDTTETPSETPTTPSDTVVGYGKVTTITGSLNMRSGAGKNYGVIAQIKQGGVVEVLDKGTTWSRVRYGGKTGYVMSSYLTFSTSRPAEDTTPDVSTGTKAQVTTVTGTLNMRSGMGTNYALKAKIPQKAYVQVLTYGPTWSYVSYNGTTGYVMTQYLTIVE